jgi:hypothetical protein
MNKSKKRLTALAGIVILCSGLTGCLESSDVIMFKPGVYQGAKDPLIGSSDAAALESRFANQMDR